MAVDLTGSAGGFFTRFGKLAGTVNSVNSFRGTTTDASVSAIFNQYQSNEQAATSTLYPSRDSYRGVHSSWLQALQTIAATTVVEQVDRDAALAPKTLAAALTELSQQMKDATASLQRPTVTLTAAANGSNYGDAQLIASATGPDGSPNDLVFAETLDVRVTADAGTGGTAFAETAAVTGDPARETAAYNWPGGSGASTTLTAVNAAGTTLLADGNFENWVSTNTPSSWPIMTGVAGTTVLRSATVLRGSYGLQITGDGSELTRLRQLVSLSPNTVYAVGFWARKSASLSAGNLRLRLTDGSSVISDDASTANSYDTAHGSLSSSAWTLRTAFFRTPRALPDATYLELYVSTALTSGQSVYIDLAFAVAPTALYAGGPYVVLVSGGTRLAVNDRFTLAVTNSGSTTSLVRQLDRFYATRQLGVRFPTASSPTISDALIA